MNQFTSHLFVGADSIPAAPRVKRQQLAVTTTSKQKALTIVVKSHGYTTTSLPSAAINLSTNQRLRFGYPLQ